MKSIWLLCLCTLLTVGGCGKSMDKEVAEQLELGARYLSELDYEQAIVAFKKVIELDPKNVEAYLALSEIYTAIGDYDNACTILEQGLSLTGAEELQRVLEQLVEDDTDLSDDAAGGIESEEATVPEEESVEFLEKEIDLSQVEVEELEILIKCIEYCSWGDAGELPDHVELAGLSDSGKYEILCLWANLHWNHWEYLEEEGLRIVPEEEGDSFFAEALGVSVPDKSTQQKHGYFHNGNYYVTAGDLGESSMTEVESIRKISTENNEIMGRFNEADYYYEEYPDAERVTFSANATKNSSGKYGGYTIQSISFGRESAEDEVANDSQEEVSISGAENYKDILDMYYHKISTSGWGENEEASYLFYFYSEVQTLSDAGYALVDLDKNGTLELIVTSMTAAEQGLIYDLYTYVNDKVVHTLSGGERDRYYLCGDNTIYNDASGGAAYTSYVKYTVNSEAGTLDLLEVVEYNGDMGGFWYGGSDCDAGVEYGWNYDLMTSITDAEAWPIIDGYENQMISIPVTSFASYSP